MMYLLKHELLLALKQMSDLIVTLAFFVLIIMLYALAIGPDPARLSAVGAAVIWVAALLAHILALERLFQADFDDGSLDLVLASGHGAAGLFWVKAIGHWVSTGLPVTILSYFLADMMFVTDKALLIVTLLMATPALSLIGAVGAALTLGARLGSVLRVFIILPLYIPILIFALGVFQTGLSSLMLLGAVLIVAIIVAGWSGGAAIKMAQ